MTDKGSTISRILNNRALEAVAYLQIVERKPTVCLLVFNQLNYHSRMRVRGFPGGAVVENLPANAGDTGSSPGLGRSHIPQSN